MTYLIHSLSGAIPLILVLSLVGSIALFLGAQLAHGVTIGPNGTMNVPGMPGTTISAPPGSDVNNITIIRGPPGDYGGNASTDSGSGPVHAKPPVFINLANTTWTLYNQTSGSTSAIQFNSDGTYNRLLHGNNLTF